MHLRFQMAAHVLLSARREHSHGSNFQRKEDMTQTQGLTDSPRPKFLGHGALSAYGDILSTRSAGAARATSAGAKRRPMSDGIFWNWE